MLRALTVVLLAAAPAAVAFSERQTRFVVPMPHDIPALTEPAAGPEDYDSIHSAVMESPRGRWFLTE